MSTEMNTEESKRFWKAVDRHIASTIEKNIKEKGPLIQTPKFSIMNNWTYYSLMFVLCFLGAFIAVLLFK